MLIKFDLLRLLNKWIRWNTHVYDEPRAGFCGWLKNVEHLTMVLFHLKWVQLSFIFWEQEQCVTTNNSYSSRCALHFWTKSFEQDRKCFFWIDSFWVILWIKRSKAWTPFVKIRLNEIRSFTRSNLWQQMSGSLTFAYLPSRVWATRHWIYF